MCCTQPLFVYCERRLVDIAWMRPLFVSERNWPYILLCSRLLFLILCLCVYVWSNMFGN